MAINETAKATVYLDGKQAETALKSLAKEAERFQKEMKEALAEGDMKKFKSAEKKLKSTQKAMGGLRKEVFSVDKVMKNLSGATLNDLQKALRKTNSEMRRMKRTDAGWNEKKKQAQLLNKELKRVRTEMGSMQTPSQRFMGTLKSWLPALSVGAFVGGIKAIGTELFSLTKQMQGDAVRSTTVFGDELGYVEEQAAKVAAQMGLTNREFVANAAATADLLIPLDFTREASAQMSVELQKLTGALDEWTGGSVGAAEVSNILTKAMLGENEQLKQLGIAIRKDSDEFRDLVKIKLKAKGVTKAQAEAMATLELVTKKSADAQAAYNKEGNQLLRWQKSVSVWWKNMKEGVVEWLSVSPVQELKNEQTEVNRLVVQLRDANISEETRAKLLNRLKQLAPEVSKSIQDEKGDVDKLTKSLEKYNSQMALRILMKEQELKIEKQGKKADNYQQLKAEHEADMVEAMNESLEWFEKKGPEYTKLVNEVLYDNTLSTVAKAEKIQRLSFKASMLGNQQLGSSINDFKVFRQRYAEESGQFTRMIEEAEAMKEKYQKIFGVDPDKKEDSPEPEAPKAKEPPKDLKLNQNKITGQFDWEKGGDEEEDETDWAMMLMQSDIDAQQELVDQRKAQMEEIAEYASEVNDRMIQDNEEYWRSQEALAIGEAELANDRMNTLLSLSGAIGAMFDQSTAMGKAAFMTEKALAIAQVWLNLPREQSAIALSASYLPVGFQQAYLAKALTMAKIRAVANTAAITATTVKGLGSRREGGYGETGPDDNEAKGIYHANEFIGAAEGVRNPTVKAVYDIIDVAQKNGTISTIDLPKAITGQLPGNSNGETSKAQLSAPSLSIPAEFYDMMRETRDAISTMNANGVKGVWEWEADKQGREKMQALENDVGFTE